MNVTVLTSERVIFNCQWMLFATEFDIHRQTVWQGKLSSFPILIRVSREALQHKGVTCNRPSYKNPHFQNEAKCTTFLVKMSFICMRMKNHFLTYG